ncbi:MAG: hypothetical protein ACHQK8_03615, partial [Bacteroidia bacterium]
MKTTTIKLCLSMMVLVLCLSSCSKKEAASDPVVNPKTGVLKLEIIVTANGDTIANNDSVSLHLNDHVIFTFKATGSSDNNLKSANYSYKLNGTKMLDSILTLSGTSHTRVDSLIIKSSGVFEFTGILTGASGNTVSTTFAFTNSVDSTFTVEKKNRAILIEFSETWAGPCGTYGVPSFDTCFDLEGNVISIMKVCVSSTPSTMNGTQSAAISSDFKVNGIPTFFVNGTELLAGGGVYTDPLSSRNAVFVLANTFSLSPVIA